ncbi:hypothetical protein ACGIF2_08460 [Cellulomonas sp. P22]|uniref:hypothetical protein n=1 Tax=Cellulomonas sp. P22 TaxID=3373189 RepID=UPI0037ADCF00
MVAHLVQLKLALLRNGLRRSAWQIVGLVVGALYGLGIVLLAIGGLVALAVADDAELSRTVVVLFGALLVLGWCVIPLFAFGVDGTLDPERFSTFAIPRRPLIVGLALAGLVGIPGVATALVALVSVGTWWRSPAAVVAGLVGAVLATATCVIGSRATTTAMAPLVTGRRVKEVAAAVVLVPLFLLGPIMGAIGSGIEAWGDALPGLARGVGWTPFGAAWAFPADVAEGAWGAAVVKLVIAVATLAALVLLWDRSLQQALTRGGRGVDAPRATAQGLGFFGRLPATPTGAVAARCLTYWRRDPRYAASMLLVLMLPVLLGFVGGRGTAMLLLGPIAAYFFGWGISADVAYDGSAFWTHVAAPVRGRVDRWGRVAGTAVIGVPATLLFTLASLVVTGRWEALLPVLGLAAGVLMTAFGVASVVSARVVYPVPKPGDSPFKTQQGSQLAQFTSQTLGGLTLLVLVAPTAALAVSAVLLGSMLLGVLAFVVGVGLGAVLLVVGVRHGGEVYDRRAPELLATLRSFA